jgi:hypothetical protein
VGGGFGGGWRGRGWPEVRERADRWAQEKEKGKRKDKKEKGFSQGFNIALCSILIG